MTALQRTRAVAAAKLAAGVDYPAEHVIREILAERIGVRPADKRVDDALTHAHELGLVTFEVSGIGGVRIVADEEAFAAIEGSAA